VGKTCHHLGLKKNALSLAQPNYLNDDPNDVEEEKKQMRGG